MHFSGILDDLDADLTLDENFFVVAFGFKSSSKMALILLLMRDFNCLRRDESFL